MDPRHIQDPSEGTCNWFLENDHFRQWASGKEAVFWLKGTPGSGKSVLTRWTYYRMLDETVSLITPTSLTIIVGFFFNSRGTVEAKSAAGFYRACIHQMVSQFPALFEYIPRDIRSSMHFVNSSLSSLQNVFSSLITPKSPMSIVAFIDALDECGDDSTDLLLTMLENIDQARKSNCVFKICFSSRPDTKFDFGPYLSLDIQKVNGAAILRFLHNEVDKVGRRLSANNRKDKLSDLQTIASLIEKRANGMFLWVRLVLPRMRDAILRYSTLNEVEVMLSKIPSELAGPHGLFGEILTKLVNSSGEESIKHAIQIFQWIVFSERPLLLNELLAALMVRKGSDSTKENSGWSCCENDMYAAERITYQCGNLVQVLDKSTVVQPIHQTVKEYFMTGQGFELLGYYSGGNTAAKCHWQITLDCAKSLTLDDVQALTCIGQSDIESHHSHLLNYALDFCFVHAQKAEAAGIATSALLDLFGLPDIRPFEKYVSLRDQHLQAHWQVCPKDDYHRPIYGPGTTFIHVAAEHGLVTCVAGLLAMGADVNARGGPYGSALQVAAENNHCRMVNTLLGHGALPDLYSLELAATEHQLVILKLLASNGLPRGEASRAMVAAATNGNSKVVRVLLECLATSASAELRRQTDQALSVLLPISKDLPLCLNWRLDHSSCLPSHCIASSVFPKTYVQRHSEEGCCCEHIVFDSDQTASILLHGGIPIIQWSWDKDGQMNWKISENTPDNPYIAISHSWVDGLGNPQANSMPLCMLKSLASLVDGINPKQCGIWIDSLCIPVKDSNAKMLAISRISEVFRHADSVLVIIRDLQESECTILEKVAEISVSIWARRMWLRLESWLAKRTYFCFSGRTISTEEIEGIICGIEETTPKEIPVDFSQQRSGPKASDIQHEPHYQLVTLTRLLRDGSFGYAGDEALFLATLLRFNLESILVSRENSDRIKKILTLFKSLPQDFVFLDGQRMEEKGFRWAPRSFVGLRETFDPSSPANPPAPILYKGLLITYQGLLLQWPAVHVSGALHISCGEGDSRSYFTVIENQLGADNRDDSFRWPEVRNLAIIFRGRPGPIDVGILVSVQGEETVGALNALEARYELRVKIYKKIYPLSPPLVQGVWTGPLQKWCVG